MYVCMYNNNMWLTLVVNSDDVEPTSLTLRWPWFWDTSNVFVSLTARLDVCDAQLIKETTSYQNQPKKNAHADSSNRSRHVCETYLIGAGFLEELTTSGQERKGW